MTSPFARLFFASVGLAMPSLLLAQPPATSPPDSIPAHWKTLLELDAEKAYIAMRYMAAAPKETVAFLRETEKPAAAVDPKIIDDLIKQLSSDRFAAREKAIQELQRQDRHAVEALKKAAQGQLDLETKRRVDALLARQEGQLSGVAMRWRRIIEVLEWVGTPDAKGVLEHWSKGADDSRLTDEARQALKRWQPSPDLAKDPKAPRVDSAGDPLPAGAVVRLGTTRWRLGEEFLDRGTIQFTAEGDLLVSDPDTFRIVDVRDGRTRSRIPFAAAVKNALLTPDQKRLVASGYSRDEAGTVSPILCAWDMKDFKKVYQWNVEGALLGFAQKGAVAVLESPAGIRQINLNTGQEVGLHPLPQGANPRGDPRGFQSSTVLSDNLIAIPGGPQRLLVYDWSDPEKVKTLAVSGRRDDITFALSPGNKYLAYSSRPGVGVHLVTVADLKEVRHLVPKGSDGAEEDGFRFRADDLTFSPDGRSLAFAANFYDNSLGGYGRGAVVVWDLENHKVRFKTRRAGTSLVFSPDSRFVAGASGGKRILVWDMATGQELTEGEDEPSSSSYNSTLGFFPNGQGICLANQEYVRLWDFPSGKPRATLPHRDARAVAVSPDSRLVAIGSYFERIRVWDIATSEPRFQIPAPSQQNLWGVAFSPNGERVNVWADDAVLRSWDAKTGRLVAEHRPRPKGVPDRVDEEKEERGKDLMDLTYHSAFSADGTRLLWHVQRLHLVDAASGKEDSSFDLEATPYRLKTSADMQWLLTMNYARGEAVALYNVPQRKRFGQIGIGQSQRTGHIAMSPDGHHFAIGIGRPDQRIDLYETATLQRRLIIRPPSGVVGELAYSPSGRYLAAAQSDRTVLVYDLHAAP